MTKQQRIEKAAALSHEKSAADIQKNLGISQRTLKRYADDPLWNHYSGKPASELFAPQGRPKQDPDERARLQSEIQRLRADGSTWASIGRELNLTRHQLRYLRQKHGGEHIEFEREKKTCLSSGGTDLGTTPRPCPSR